MQNFDPLSLARRTYKKLIVSMGRRRATLKAETQTGNRAPSTDHSFSLNRIVIVVAVNHPSETLRSNTKHLRRSLTIVSVVVMFFVCWAPFHAQVSSTNGSNTLSLSLAREPETFVCCRLKGLFVVARKVFSFEEVKGEKCIVKVKSTQINKQTSTN